MLQSVQILCKSYLNFQWSLCCAEETFVPQLWNIVLLHWQDQWLHRSLPLNIRKWFFAVRTTRMSLPGCPGRLWSPWRWVKAIWTGSCTASRWPCLSRGLWPYNLQRSCPASELCETQCQHFQRAFFPSPAPFHQVSPPARAESRACSVMKMASTDLPSRTLPPRNPSVWTALGQPWAGLKQRISWQMSSAWVSGRRKLWICFDPSEVKLPYEEHSKTYRDSLSHSYSLSHICGLCLKPHLSLVLHFLTILGKLFLEREEREAGFLHSQMAASFWCVLTLCSLLETPKE